MVGGIDVDWGEAAEILSTGQGEADGLIYLRVWDVGDPTPELLEAVQGMKRIRNIRLLGYSALKPAEPWEKVFERKVTTTMSEAELRTWVQVSLGGAYSTTAIRLLDRVGWDTEAAARAIRNIRLVTDSATPEDVAELVDPEPAIHFIEALTRCDVKTARLHAPLVQRPAGVVRALEARVLQLWQIIEHRPAITAGKAREASRFLALDEETVKALLPWARYYSRQKVASRLRALAMVDEELRRGTPPAGLLETLTVLW